MSKTLKLISLAIFAGVLSSSSFAMSASDAKKAGLIEENCKGYVQPKSNEGQAVAEDINAKRRVEYARLAAEQKLTIEVVAVTAGAKLCGK